MPHHGRLRLLVLLPLPRRCLASLFGQNSVLGLRHLRAVDQLRGCLRLLRTRGVWRRHGVMRGVGPNSRRRPLLRCLARQAVQVALDGVLHRAAHRAHRAGRFIGFGQLLRGPLDHALQLVVEALRRTLCFPARQRLLPATADHVRQQNAARRYDLLLRCGGAGRIARMRLALLRCPASRGGYGHGAAGKGKLRRGQRSPALPRPRQPMRGLRQSRRAAQHVRLLRAASLSGLPLRPHLSLCGIRLLCAAGRRDDLRAVRAVLDDDAARLLRDDAKLLFPQDHALQDPLLRGLLLLLVLLRAVLFLLLTQPVHKQIHVQIEVDLRRLLRRGLGVPLLQIGKAQGAIVADALCAALQKLLREQLCQQPKWGQGILLSRDGHILFADRNGIHQKHPL